MLVVGTLMCLYVVWRGSSDEVKSAVVIYLYLLGISL